MASLCHAAALRGMAAERLSAGGHGLATHRAVRVLSSAASPAATGAQPAPAPKAAKEHKPAKPANPNGKFNEAWDFATPWKLKAAVILQRNPVIMRDLYDWEQQWHDFKQKIDAERARDVPAEWFHKNYGMEGADITAAAAAESKKAKKKDAPAGDQAAAGKGGEGGEAAPAAGSAAAAQQAQRRFRLTQEDTAVKETDEDEEKERKIELMPRETEADLKNDRKSLNRALQRRLYLIIKTEKPDGPYEWHFPETYWAEGETMRQAAERTADKWLGTAIDRFFISNAPSAHFRYPYSPEAQKKLSAYGVKTFFYHAQLLDGEPQLAKGARDHLWVTRDELAEYFTPDYFKFVSGALPPL